MHHGYSIRGAPKGECRKKACGNDVLAHVTTATGARSSTTDAISAARAFRGSASTRRRVLRADAPTLLWMECGIAAPAA